MEDKVQSKKKFYKRWWFWVLAVLAFLIIIGASDNSSKNTELTNTNTLATAQENAIPITAVQLMRDYDANEVAADAKYKEKIVEVSGTITNVGKDILDTPYVALNTGENSFFQVQCMFDKSDQAQLATLSKNTRIIFRGLVSGKLMNIIIRECSLVQ